jgi:AraC-like DNA-binding protein
VDVRVQIALEALSRSRSVREGLARAARLVNLSPSRTRQLIKSETGLSPKKHLRHFRMDRAAELLSSTFLCVKEIAAQIGVGDVSHFVRDFKTTFGATPTGYRRALRDRYHRTAA